MTTIDGELAWSWRQYMSRLDALLTSAESPGTTASRPNIGVRIGQFHFDTTLGKPVWAKTVTPNGLTQTVVWVDGSGATV